jgi:acyl-CoA thioesterase
MKTPRENIEAMMSNDLFSKWLGIELLAEGEGYCKLQMYIRPEMCNGFGMAHGGITYSFADSALAFASNSRGQQALSFETSISHIKPLQAGDTIVATATETSLGRKLGIYTVDIENEHGELVAAFKGTVYLKDE